MLEEAAAVVGLGGDEEGAVAFCSGGDRHTTQQPSAAKTTGLLGCMAR